MPLAKSLPVRVGAAIVAVAMLAIGFLPLFGGPGYESALAGGLVVAFATAIAAALDGAGAPAAREPFDAFCRGVAVGAIFAGVAFATTLLHGLRAGFCDLAGGAALFALGPGAGGLLAGAWGAAAGELTRRAKRRWLRRALAVVLGAGLPLASALVSVVRFWATPIVFAYDPFVGHFSGVLYDTVIGMGDLGTYRAGSAATLLAAFVVALHLERDPAGRLRFHSIGRPGLVVAGVAALAGSAGVTLAGDRLGHWQTAATIAERLGAKSEGARCDVVHARTIRPADAQRVAKECDAHVAQNEAWLGVRFEGRLTVYLFADAAQKAELMGAADTQIAKPWRREVYVSAAGYPHPVLGHEIMHVVAGAAGRGPFRIAGALGGLVPNPGLIEGVAVAAEPRDGNLGPAEWAKAMKDLGLLPPLERLFALGFLGENASLAYTVSGAFVDWVHEHHGAEAVRVWYGGRPLPEVVGRPWSELEAAWKKDLDAITLSEAARAQAKAKFDRPAVFGRRCPHSVDACKKRGEELRASGDFVGAVEQLDRAIALDPGDGHARVARALALRHRGGGAADDALLAIAADERLSRDARDRAAEVLGDLALARGDGDAATARYDEIATRIADEDQLRTLDVKRLAGRDARARPAVVALLVGEGPRGPDKVRAAELLGAWAASAPDDGLPRYLLARQDVATGELERAAKRLDEALAAPIALPRVVVEARRLRLVAACGTGDVAGAERAYLSYAAIRELAAARRQAARALVERCTGAPAPGAPGGPGG